MKVAYFATAPGYFHSFTKIISEKGNTQNTFWGIRSNLPSDLTYISTHVIFLINGIVHPHARREKRYPMQWRNSELIRSALCVAWFIYNPHLPLDTITGRSDPLQETTRDLKTSKDIERHPTISHHNVAFKCDKFSSSSDTFHFQNRPPLQSIHPSCSRAQMYSLKLINPTRSFL